MSTKKWAETQPTFETAFFQNRFTLWHIELNGKLNLLLSKFCLLFSRNAKMTPTDQTMLDVFLFFFLFYQTFKSSSSKKRFPKYAIGTACFKDCLLFHVIIGRHFLTTNLSLPTGFLQLPRYCVL